jgi:replicative DNA helicase
VDSYSLDTGLLSRTNYDSIIEVIKEIHGNNSMYLKSFNNTDLIKIKKFIKEKIEKDKIKIVFIDYLTMIIPAPTYTNRWEQVSEISRSLKSMAMEFQIPFVVLSPVNRNITDDIPELYNLSESGSIEYEADRVIILYKKAKKKKDMEEEYSLNYNENVVTAYIAKNRRGTTKKINFLFDYKMKAIKDIKINNDTDS